MADEDTLLEAIAAAPDDDAPRLVYADWLMQRGDPRGELVALQCALAAADALDEPLAHEAQAIERVQALLAEHHQAWTERLRAIAPDVGFTCRRGLVEHAVDWGHPPVFETARALAEAAPLLRSFALPCVTDPSWAALPIDRLESLELLEPEYLTGLDAPTLPRLRRLQLTGAMLDAQVLLRLVAMSPHLDHLGVILSPYRPRFDDERGLVGQLVLPARHARSLFLADVALEDPSPLAELPLEQLALHDTGLPPRALLALVTRLPRLHTLELFDSQHRLGGLALDELLAAAPHLRRLAVRRAATLTSSDAAALARSPHARSLRRLDLSHCQIGAPGAAALAASEHLRGLVRLELAGNPLAPEQRDRVERAFTRTHYEPPAPAYPADLLEDLSRDRKIEAIKRYREQTGVGLASAKCAAERVIDELGLPGYVPQGAVARWVRC